MVGYVAQVIMLKGAFYVLPPLPPTPRSTMERLRWHMETFQRQADELTRLLASFAPDA